MKNRFDKYSKTNLLYFVHPWDHDMTEYTPKQDIT